MNVLTLGTNRLDGVNVDILSTEMTVSETTYYQTIHNIYGRLDGDIMNVITLGTNRLDGVNVDILSPEMTVSETTYYQTIYHIYGGLEPGCRLHERTHTHNKPFRRFQCR